MNGISSDWQNDSLYVRCSGEIGFQSANDFLSVIQGTLSAKHVVIDLSEVVSIDHLIVQLINSYYHTCLKFRISLDIVGLDAMLGVGRPHPVTSDITELVLLLKSTRKDLQGSPLHMRASRSSRASLNTTVDFFARAGGDRQAANHSHAP